MTITTLNRYGYWLVATFFYVYVYALRIFPNVMIEDIRADFHLSASSFSTLGSLYLLSYSLLQIPLGLMLDRLGIRKVLLWSVSLCIAGSLTFGLSQHLFWLQIARITIGAGSAVAFMASVKIATDYFSSDQRGLLAGASLSLGALGALVLGKGLVFLHQYYGWRQIAMVSSAVGFAILLAVLYIIRNTETAASTRPPISFKKLACSARTLKYAILTIGLYAPLSVIADLWGTAFLRQKWVQTPAQASSLSLSVYLGLGLGSLIIPWLAERFGKRDLFIRTSTILLLLLFSLLLYTPTLPISWSYPLMIAIGIFAGAEMVCFSAALSNSNAQNSGSIIGVVNTFNMLGTGVMLQVVGTLLDLSWKGTDGLGTTLRQYTPHDFMFAFSSLTGLLLLCSIFAYYRCDTGSTN